MRLRFFLLFLVCVCVDPAQNIDSIIQTSHSILKKFNNGDSVIYYQCHVEAITQTLTTASGQTLTGQSSQVTITEKMVIQKQEGKYFMRYYSSSLTGYPNRRFSGLKIREKAYWEFRLEHAFFLTDLDIRFLLALEKSGREATEYDYTISKYNKNQIIIKRNKDFKQLGIDEKYLISKMLVKK